MNKAQAIFLIILAILIWFVIYDLFTLIMMILIFGACISIMLLFIGAYSIYIKLGDKG